MILWTQLHILVHIISLGFGEAHGWASWQAKATMLHLISWALGVTQAQGNASCGCGVKPGWVLGVGQVLAWALGVTQA